MTLTRDLHISVLCVSMPQMCLSHVVVWVVRGDTSSMTTEGLRGGGQCGRVAR
jgi:hypothetical protein